MATVGSYQLAQVARLLDQLMGPAMPEARCKGMAPTFDAEIAGESALQRRARLARAADLCASCPVSARCALVARELPPRLRSGTWAGRPYC